MHKKIMLWTVCMTLIAATIGFSGCQQSPAPSQTVAPTETAEAIGTDPMQSPPITLQMLTRDESTLNGVENNPLVKEVEQTFNVKIEWVVRPAGGDVVDWWNLKATSGDTPDYMEDLSFTFSMISNYVSDGLLAEIPVDKVAVLSPSYAQWLEEHKWIWNDKPWEFFTINEKNYTLPISVWWISKNMYMGYRQDWMEAVGVTQVPETLDDVLTLYDKFTNNDPDGNSVKDTYAYIGIQSDPIWAFYPFWGAFGVYPGMFTVDNNGNIVRGEVQPAMKDALAWVKTNLIDKGYVDPEWVTTGFELAASKMNSGLYGSSWQNFECFIKSSGAWFWDGLKTIVPNSKYVLSAGPKGPNGDQGMMQFNPANGVGMFFSKRLEQEPEKLEKYIQVICTTNTDLTWLERVYRGTEGVTYSKNADGTYQWIGNYTDANARAAEKIGQIGFPCEQLFQSLSGDLLVQAEDNAYFQKYKDALNGAKGKYDILGMFAKPTWDANSANLNTIATQFFNDVLTGKRSVDEFDDYVKQWNDAGGAKVMEEAQRIYNLRLK